MEIVYRSGEQGWAFAVSSTGELLGSMIEIKGWRNLLGPLIGVGDLPVPSLPGGYPSVIRYWKSQVFKNTLITQGH